MRVGRTSRSSSTWPPTSPPTAALAVGRPHSFYDQNEVQRALSAFYDDLAEHMPYDRIVHVDGAGTADAVHLRVWEAYQRSARGAA